MSIDYEAMITPARFSASLVMVSALLAGCASQAPAPIEQKTRASTAATLPAFQRPAPRRPARPSVPAPASYRVASGDTLYSIAFRFGLDHRQVARWNDLGDPDRIVVGQTLRLTPDAVKGGTHEPVAQTASPAPSAVVAAIPSTKAGTPPPAASVRADTDTGSPVDAQAIPPAKLAGDGRKVQGIGWTWPALGKSRRAVAASGSQGLEILGARGQPIMAAATGQVVYSGNGLRGYGQLIIIKHDDTFLSAYAHNEKLLVAEGARVNEGQKIAEMGDSEASEVMLHFEIRKNGKAVEPLQFLPSP